MIFNNTIPVKIYIVMRYDFSYLVKLVVIMYRLSVGPAIKANIIMGDIYSYPNLTG